MKGSYILIFLITLASTFIPFHTAHALVHFPNPFTDNVTVYDDGSVAASVGRVCSVGGATIGAIIGLPAGGVLGLVAAPFDYVEKGAFARAASVPVIGAMVGSYAGAIWLGRGAGSVCGFPLSFIGN